MKQIIQSYRTGELWLAEVPAPALKSSGVVIQTRASLVSAGTERMMIELAQKSLLGKARARPDLVKKVLDKIKTEGLMQTIEKVGTKLDTPISLGYSCAGTVIESGRNVTGLKPGDRVACGGAGYATHADYNYIPQNLVVRIPDGVSFEDASFTTLGSIAMQGVRQADVRLGERIVVVGLGLLGLLATQILKAAGCKVLGTDLDPERCKLARELGADEAVSSGLIDAAATFSEGRGADAVIITAATPSNQPIEEAAEISRMKGRVVVVGMVGMNVPRDPFYKKELDLRLSMSYGPGRYDPNYEENGQDYPFAYVRWTEQRNMQSFLDLVEAGRITPGRLITHRFGIDAALKAYEMLESRQEKYIGIILEYPQTDAAVAPVRRVDLRSAAPQARIGVGFIGAGNFTKGVLLPALKRQKDFELVGMCTATGMSGSETAKKSGFAYSTTDSEELLKDERVNTIFITTQHDSHARFATAALRAGKNVFVEKPLCINDAQLDSYFDAFAANSSGKKPLLMAGFNRRFSPHAKAMRDAVTPRTSPLVISYRVNAGFIPKEVWIQNPETGGGRIIGEVCHFVDFCEFVSGSTPRRVFADCVSTTDSRYLPEDSVVITITYADGTLATIQYLAHGATALRKERVEAFADGKTIILDDYQETVFHGTKRSALKGRQEKGFDEELAAFLDAVRRGGEPPIPFESLVRTTQVTFAIVQSLKTGRPVELQD